MTFSFNKKKQQQILDNISEDIGRVHRIWHFGINKERLTSQQINNICIDLAHLNNLLAQIRDKNIPKM